MTFTSENPCKHFSSGLKKPKRWSEKNKTDKILMLSHEARGSSLPVFIWPMSLLLFSDQFFPVMFLPGRTLCSTLSFLPHFHYILGRTMNADSKFTQWQQRAERTENWHQVHLDDRESCRVTQKRSNIGWVWWTNRQWGGGQCLWAHRCTYSDLEWEKSLDTFPPKQL